MRRLLATASLCLLMLVSLQMGGTATAAPARCDNAVNVLGCACDAGSNAGNNSAACSVDSAKDPITGPNGVLQKVSLLMAVLGGIVAVIILIISGFRYIISTGDPQKAASARSSAIGAAIGLVIIAAAESVILFVVSKL